MMTAPHHSTIKLDVPSDRHQSVVTKTVHPNATALTARADAIGGKPEMLWTSHNTAA